MSKLAIIPARGGSKRIPRKNIRPFLGHPIIKYSIDAALNAGLFDEVMVSTDDEEIARIAEACGAQIPFLRSAATSDDHATTADVLLEVLSRYSAANLRFEYFCCIYPTAPLISADRLAEGFRLLDAHQADSVIPVVRFSYPVQRALKIDDGRLMMATPQHTNTRSQDLPFRYHDAGQFYWARTERFLSQQTLFTGNARPLIISELEVQDIDSEADWKIAEMKYQITQCNSTVF